MQTNFRGWNARTDRTQFESSTIHCATVGFELVLQSFGVVPTNVGLFELGVVEGLFAKKIVRRQPRRFRAHSEKASYDGTSKATSNRNSFIDAAEIRPFKLMRGTGNLSQSAQLAVFFFFCFLFGNEVVLK